MSDVLRLRNYIGGVWSDTESEQYTEVRNPATDEVIALCPLSSQAEADLAVQAAKSAFWAWRTTPVPERAELMFSLKEAMTKHRNELAATITAEHGKTYREAQDEMTRTLQYIEDACAIPQLMKGAFSEGIAHGVDEYFLREPLGVFLILPPFNFPAMIPSYFAWAVASGNTVVLKPSNICPITSVKIVELAERSGFPAGVVNVVHGDGEAIGGHLLSHPDVVGVSFVGSSKVGLEVYRRACSFGKRAQVQGGAKNHAVVMEDAVMEEAVKNLVSSCFGHVGERCFAVSNVLVADSVYDTFVELFLASARRLRLGNGMDEGVDMGPVVTRTHLERLHGEIASALQEGARLLLDGRGVKVEGYPKGYFLGPTVFEAEPGMRVFDEEIFGPVRTIRRVRDLEEAIAIINRSPYGHTAVIYTESGAYARTFVEGCNVGQVGVNVGTPAPIAFYPVGGRKLSFFGSTRGRANDAIEFYTDKKVVVSRWLKAAKNRKVGPGGFPVNW
jgi:malonate-semialdehyde dehydrogenase (acetylating)/methylmalonate-semialdehyde dehydrogenase